jgi:hypothetical protein
MRVTRGELLDWYVDGDESAVFVDGHVIVLSALATAIVDLVGEDGADEAEVVAGLVERFGEPDGGAGAMTRRALEDLAERKVVVLAAKP